MNPTNPIHESQLSDMQAGARTIGMKLFVSRASNEREVGEAFATFAQQRVGAVIVPGDPFFQDSRDQLAVLEARYSIPAVHEGREFTAAGGLMSYGASLPDAFRQLGIYAGRILKGTKAADLPVMQPTKFDLVINLKTAKALGLSVPQTLLATADEVIE